MTPQMQSCGNPQQWVKESHVPGLMKLPSGCSPRRFAGPVDWDKRQAPKTILRDEARSEPGLMSARYVRSLCFG